MDDCKQGMYARMLTDLMDGGMHLTALELIQELMENQCMASEKVDGPSSLQRAVELAAAQLETIVSRDSSSEGAIFRKTSPEAAYTTAMLQ